jgi:hypothetical protein
MRTWYTYTIEEPPTPSQWNLERLERLERLAHMRAWRMVAVAVARMVACTI